MRQLSEITDTTLQKAVELRFSPAGLAIVKAAAIAGTFRDHMDVACRVEPSELRAECDRRNLDVSNWRAVCDEVLIVDTALWRQCDQEHGGIAP